MWKTLKQKFLNLFWPKQCINCGKEGKYLCDDCFALIDILRDPPIRNLKYINGIHYAVSYQEKLIKTAIHLYKYKRIKGLSEVMVSLIIAHLKLSNKLETLNNGMLCAIPLHKTKLKKRGFNQAEEIAKELAKSLNLPFVPNALIKTKKTPAQMTLNKKERKQNIVDCFKINPKIRKQIINKKIFLIDDVLTTGATMQECARILKQNKASEVWGIVVARD